MRVLIIGARHPWRMEAAVQRALQRQGHEVRLFDDRRSRRQVGFRLTQWRVQQLHARFRPDFLVLSKCHGLALDTVAGLIRDVPNAMWYHDPQWHSAIQRPDIAHIAAVGRLAQVFFVTGFVEAWQAHIPSARFLPAAGAREIVPVPPEPRAAATVSFVGSGYDAIRAQFLLALSQQVQVRVWGPGWEPWRTQLAWNGGVVEHTAFAQVCASAVCTLGILPANASGATTYASDRLWMTLLAGGCYLGPWAPGLDLLLHEAVHCLWYRDLETCVQQVAWATRHAAERRRICQQGEAFAREHHTYDARLPFLLSGHAWVNPL
ncbi:MAG: glycosyltransferase [Candidatus Tectimicrobiota bacterium]